MSKFGKAFAAARKGGAKEFDFNGKKYNTKMKAEGAPKKKSSLPKTATVGPSRASAVSGMSKPPSFSGLTEMGKKNKRNIGEPFKAPKGAAPTKSSPYMKDSSALNDFKQKEARRSSDEATGKKNAPNVKRAIGKFMIGKAYKG